MVLVWLILNFEIFVYNFIQEKFDLQGHRLCVIVYG